MKRALKWSAGVVLTLVAVAAIAAVVLYAMGRNRLYSTYAIDLADVPVREDSAALARGEHLVEAVIACGECHGEGLRGEAFFSDPGLGTVVSANLTPGAGSVTRDYTDADWIRAIRHALGPDSMPLIAMPSSRFIHLSGSDLGAMVGYLKNLPPIDSEPPATELEPLAFILTSLGQLDELIPAEYIDHDTPLPEAPPEGPTVEYGRYLMSIATCRDCHGDALAGGQAGPGEPIGPNITPAGAIADWSHEDFVRLFRTGRRPDGRQVIDFMPWRYYRGMTDAELGAIWRYLRSLEPVETPAEFRPGP